MIWLKTSNHTMKCGPVPPLRKTTEVQRVWNLGQIQTNAYSSQQLFEVVLKIAQKGANKMAQWIKGACCEGLMTRVQSQTHVKVKGKNPTPWSWWLTSRLHTSSYNMHHNNNKVWILKITEK